MTHAIIDVVFVMRVTVGFKHTMQDYWPLQNTDVTSATSNSVTLKQNVRHVKQDSLSPGAATAVELDRHLTLPAGTMTATELDWYLDVPLGAMTVTELDWHPTEACLATLLHRMVRYLERATSLKQLIE